MCVIGLTLTLWIYRYIIIAIAFYVYPDDAGDIGSMVKNFFSNHA